MADLTDDEIARIRGTLANPIVPVERVRAIAEALPRLLDEVERRRKQQVTPVREQLWMLADETAMSALDGIARRHRERRRERDRRALALLQRIEWQGAARDQYGHFEGEECPECRWPAPERPDAGADAGKHAPDCALANLIAELMVDAPETPEETTALDELATVPEVVLDKIKAREIVVMRHDGQLHPPKNAGTPSAADKPVPVARIEAVAVIEEVALLDGTIHMRVAVWNARPLKPGEVIDVRGQLFTVRAWAMADGGKTVRLIVEPTK